MVIMEPIGQGDPKIAVCTLCGAFCSQGSAAKNLGTTCMRFCAHSQQKTRLNRMEAGKHPLKERFGDLVLYHALASRGS